MVPVDGPGRAAGSAVARGPARGDRGGSVPRGLCPGGIREIERIVGLCYLAAALRRCAQYAFMRRLTVFFCSALIVRRGRVAAFLAFFAAPGPRRPTRPPSVLRAPSTAVIWRSIRVRSTRSCCSVCRSIVATCATWLVSSVGPTSARPDYSAHPRSRSAGPPSHPDRHTVNLTVPSLGRCSHRAWPCIHILLHLPEDQPASENVSGFDGPSRTLA